MVRIHRRTLNMFLILSLHALNTNKCIWMVSYQICNLCTKIQIYKWIIIWDTRNKNQTIYLKEREINKSCVLCIMYMLYDYWHSIVRNDGVSNWERCHYKGYFSLLRFRYDTYIGLHLLYFKKLVERHI